VRSTVLVSVLSLLAATGCVQRCPETMVSREQLVAEYNANAAAVRRLWARVDMKITLPPEMNVPVSLSADGVMLLGKTANKLGPHDFVLVGRQSGQEVFRLGCSASQGIYYFLYRLGKNACAYWGRQELAGAAGVRLLPIDPNDLLAVLTICSLPDDFTKLPTVTLTTQRTPQGCAYKLTYLDRQPDTRRIVIRREVYFPWDDRKQRRPYLIRFFGADGRCVLRARLRDYEPIESTGPTYPAAMPTRIQIDWPQRKSRIELKLSQMTTAERGDPAQAARLDEQMLPEHVIQVDKGLSVGGANG